MKKKILSFLLGLCLCISFALPLYAIDGPINADDDAELVIPTLEMTTIPTGAAAIAHNLITNQTYYYRVNGNILPSVDGTFSEPGWMPEGVSVNHVIGSDNREFISDTQEAPCRAIAFLEIYFPYGDPDCGTATMISPNAALTAAHCLYDTSRGGWATRVVVRPATSGSVNNPLNPYGTAEATEIVMSIPYFETENSLNGDWAVMRLSSNIGNSSGFLGFQYIARNMESESAVISGYPNDKNGYTITTEDGKEFIRTAFDQYWGSGEIDDDVTCTPYIASNTTSYQNRRFEYEIDATGGQSGAPILYRNDDSYQIIGMHIAGITTESNVYNMGYALTYQVFNFLWSYKNNPQ